MEGTFVAVSSFGITGAEGEVEGTAHFFVEENLSGGSVDSAIGSESALADAACAVVLVEHGDEEILAFICSDLGGAAIFHDDACVADGVALIDAAFVEKHHAMGSTVFGT